MSTRLFSLFGMAVLCAGHTSALAQPRVFLVPAEDST